MVCFPQKVSDITVIVVCDWDVQVLYHILFDPEFSEDVVFNRLRYRSGFDLSSILN